MKKPPVPTPILEAITGEESIVSRASDPQGDAHNVPLRNATAYRPWIADCYKAGVHFDALPLYTIAMYDRRAAAPVCCAAHQACK